VILADTSIWIDLFRHGNSPMQKLLSSEQIRMHPYVVAELALGSLKDRPATLQELDLLTEVKVATLQEVRSMIEGYSLYSRGIGFIDAHLVASCLLTRGTKLWTRDARLQAVARALHVDAGLPSWPVA
jgi:predicted nucleic acid-binding protein